MFKKGNKGITLIALVITIIVLLILAGITIAQITGQDSAPEKAAQAKIENDRGAAKDAATMLVTEKIQGYYEEKYEKTPATTTATNQLEYIAEKLGSGVKTGDYTVTVTAAGVITVTKGTETLATGTVNDAGVITWDGTVTGGNTDNTSGGPTVVGGIETIQIGDSVNYNPGNLSTASVELPEGAEIERTKLAAVSLPTGATLTSNVTANQATDWRVLDVTSGGDVLIVPTNGTLPLLQLSGMDGYNNSIAALNNIALIYKNPIYAKSARSITIDDVNKLENKTVEQVGTTGTSSDLTITENSRYGVDENLNIVDYGNVENRIYAATQETYGYGYQMVNSELGLPDSWLASRCLGGFDGGRCEFNVRFTEYGEVRDVGNRNMRQYLFAVDTNYSDSKSETGSVCPVVYLKSGITMEKDENGVWQLSVE